MGMFDYLSIHNKHLPENLKKNFSGWQTKSRSKLLNLLYINEDGKLFILEGILGGEVEEDFSDLDFSDIKTFENEKILKIMKLDFYTGEIRFYQSIGKNWYEFVAFFKNGNLLNLIDDSKNNGGR